MENYANLGVPILEKNDKELCFGACIATARSAAQAENEPAM